MFGIEVLVGGGCRDWSKALDLRSKEKGSVFDRKSSSEVMRGFKSHPPHL
jgi:hypothetical protein